MSPMVKLRHPLGFPWFQSEVKHPKLGRLCPGRELEGYAGACERAIGQASGYGDPMAWCGASVASGRVWWERSMKCLGPSPCSGDLTALGTGVENSL